MIHGNGFHNRRTKRGSVAPPVVNVIQQAALLYAPGYNAIAKITSNGSLQTYTSPALPNLSGKPMTVVSLVNIGWFAQAETSGAQEVNVGNSFPVSAVIKNAAGTTLGTFTWASSTTGTVPNGGKLVSDAITLSQALLPLDTFTIVLTGTQTSGLFYAPSLGLTGVRTHTTNTGINPISGYFFGDSILTNNASFAATACAGAFPAVIQSVIGWKLASASGSLFAKRADLLTVLGATHAYSDLGVNDLTTTAAAMVTNAGNIADQIHAAGLQMWWSTATPVVTSSDGSYDLSHQTPSASEGTRTSWNASVRGLLSGKFDRYIDLADAAETSRDSGIWKYGAATSNRLTDKLVLGTAIAVSNGTQMFLDLNNLGGSCISSTIVGVTGVNAGISRTISSTPSANFFTVTSAWPTTPSVSDTFNITVFTDKGTSDGTHPSAPYTAGPGRGGHYLLADAFEASIRAAANALGYNPMPKFVQVETSRSGYTMTAGYTFFFAGNTATIKNDLNNNLLAGDLLLLMAVTPNAPISTPSGWTAITSQGSGTAGTSSGLCVQLFWQRYAAPAPGTPPQLAVAGFSNHAMVGIYAFRGVSQSASPIDVFAGLTDSNGTTTITWPSLTTGVSNDNFINFGADNVSSLSAKLSAVTASALGNPTTLYDLGTTNGVGNGFFAVAGAAGAAGSVYAGASATLGSSASLRQLISVGIKGGV